MKRMNVIGPCLVAVAALAAAIATGAQAEVPQFGQCAAVKKGFYSNSTCTTRDEKKGAPKGKFEWQAGPQATCVAVKKGFYSNSECTTRDEKKGAPKGKFEKACASNCAAFTTTSGPVTFYTFEPENEEEPATLPQGATLTGVGGTVKCTKSTGTGAIVGPQEDTETITYTGCDSNGHSCSSPGQAAGTLVAPQFTGELVLLPAGKGVGVLDKPAPSELQIDCGTVENRIPGGEALGVVTGDIGSPSTSSVQAWAVNNPSEGIQAEQYYLNAREREHGGPSLHWESHIEGYEGSPFGKFTGTGLEAEQKITSEAPLDIRP